MANTTIPQLRPIESISDLDALPIDNGEETLKITISQLKELIGGAVVGVPRGVCVPYMGIDEPQGFISCMGKSIGKNGADHSGDDFFPLYEMIWNMGGVVSNSGNPIYLAGVKGGSALEDWNAEKIIWIDFSVTGLVIRAKQSTIDLGQYQGDATKLPNVPFTTNSVGDHRHANFNNTQSNAGSIALSNSNSPNRRNGASSTVAYDMDGRGGLNPTVGMSSQTGAHTHTITGGDAETRMKSLSLNWIVKY